MKKQVIITCMCIFMLVLSFIGFTYSYYITGITGNNNASSIIVHSDELTVTYNDTQYFTFNKISPGWAESKTFTVTNNSSITVYYDVIWESVSNNFVNQSTLKYSLTSTNNGGYVNNAVVPSSGSNISIVNGIVINSGVTQRYTITVSYENASFDQSSDMTKTFEGKLSIRDNNHYKNLLSSEYTKVEYIESTGTQYIDTTYILESTSERVYIDFMKTNTSTSTSLFGSEYSVNGNQSTRIFSLIPHGGASSNLYCGRGGSYAFSSALNNRYIYDVSLVGNNTKASLYDYTTGLTQYYTATHQFTNGNINQIPYSVCLFCNQTYAGGFNQKASARIYSFKLWDNNELVIDYIPCYRNSDRKPGMCDTVTGTFFPSNSAGNFVLP